MCVAEVRETSFVLHGMVYDYEQKACRNTLKLQENGFKVCAAVMLGSGA